MWTSAVEWARTSGHGTCQTIVTYGVDTVPLAHGDTPVIPTAPSLKTVTGQMCSCANATAPRGAGSKISARFGTRNQKQA